MAKPGYDSMANCRACNHYTFRHGKPYCIFGIFMINCQKYEKKAEIVEAIPVEGLDIKKFVDRLHDMQGTKD